MGIIILAIICLFALYLVENIILKKDIPLKKIFIPISISYIITFVIGYVLTFIVYKLQRLDEVFVLPLILSTLFIVLVFLLYKTTHKLQNSSIAIFLAIIFVPIYFNFFATIDNKFLFNINRTTKAFQIVNNKVQNEYIILFQNLSDNQKKISLSILNNDDIKIIEPSTSIQIEGKEVLKVNVLLESKSKNIKNKKITIEASNGNNKERRDIIFIYR